MLPISNPKPDIIQRAHSHQMAAMEQHIRLAQSLPPRLLDFFRKFPPPQVSSTISSQPLTQPETIQITENTSSADPNAAASTTEVSTDTLPEANMTSDGRKKNPFLPFKNPRTGNWHPPVYSLRRQGELFKLAQAHNVLPLMPPSPKHPELKEQKRIDHGLRVQGTGVGKKVKGKLWERTLRTRLEDRRKAVESMPETIRLWKERGHGRYWKKWPK